MFSAGKLSVTLEDILVKVKEIDILSYYLNVTRIPTFINSPLREDKDLLLDYILLMVKEYILQTYLLGIEEVYLTSLVECGDVNI